MDKNYNQALQSIGDKGLTDDKDLQGKREFGIDSYVGNYTADYDDFSGNEIIFGGTALERDNGNKIEMMNGNRIQIKRKQFEKMIDTVDAI